MASFDVSLEESSRVCGANSARTFVRVTLPVLRPAILAAFILCVIRCMASFAVPSAIGMPGRKYVLATHIYRMVSTGFAADYGQAAALGVSVLVLSIVLIYVYRYFTSAGEKFVTIAGRGFKPTTIELKRAKIPVFIILAILSFLLIVLPVVVLGYISLLPYSMAPSAKAFASMSLKNWSIVLSDPVSLLSIKNSLFLGVVGASLGIILSIFVAYVIVKVRTKASGVLETLSFLSFSFGHRHRCGLYVVFCANTSLCHYLGPAHRLYRHVPALRHQTADQRLCANSQSSGRIIASGGGDIPHYLPTHCGAAAHTGHRIRLGAHGDNVLQGAYALGHTVPTRFRGSGGADPALF